MGAAAGLALLAKHTAIPYLVPFAVVVAIQLFRQRTRYLPYAGLLVGIAFIAALNWGYLQRNLQTYGSIAGPAERVGNQTTQSFDLRSLASNILRNASLQAGTPSRYVNKAIAIGITWLHEQAGIDVNDPRTTSEGVFRVKPPITHETVASNPMQAYFIFFGSLFLIFQYKRFPQTVRSYSWLCLVGFFLLSILFKWKVTGARYQLPFFVLFAPAAGWMLENIRSRVFVGSVMIVFCLGAIPSLMFNPSRPLMNGVTDSTVESVLLEPRDQLYFANASYEATPYLEMTRLVGESTCQDIGLMLPGGEIEYQIWALLGTPRDDIQVEWIVAGTPSARYSPLEFHPCAIVCLECPPGWGESNGFETIYRADPFRLLIKPSGNYD